MRVVHTLSAFNTARGVENPLHDDDAARRLGYRAGLIGGVDMYGYMTYAAVRHWGRAWLDAGEADCALLKPLHEGDPCDVVVLQENDERLRVELRSRGETCASAAFGLRPRDRCVPGMIEPCEPRALRPPATPETLAQGTLLPTLLTTQTEAEARQFLIDERDDLAVYPQDQLMHPGYLLRLCNFTLSKNFILGPWIHTASKVRNFSAMPARASVEARSRVLAHYEKRGHLMVDVEVQLIAQPVGIACAVTHSAIYRPRAR